MYAPEALTLKVPYVVANALPVGAVPLNKVTVLVSPASASVSLPRTLPLTVLVPANPVFPGFTPDSTTAAASATAIGGSLAPFSVKVSVEELLRPAASRIV